MECVVDGGEAKVVDGEQFRGDYTMTTGAIICCHKLLDAMFYSPTRALPRLRKKSITRLAGPDVPV
jgi:hypothetical protein